MEGERENRFAHLLKPIRDLAENWNIDVARDLEEYVQELESITISFDGGKTNVNFAKAALVIQGSACVYSKKVEYLYNLIYQTLDRIVSDKRKRQKSSVRASGEDEDAFEEAEQEFLLLDWTLKQGSNIDLPDLQSDQSASTSMASRTPNLSRQGSLMARTPLSRMGSLRSDAGAGAGAFNLAVCQPDGTGALMLGASASHQLLREPDFSAAADTSGTNAPAAPSATAAAAAAAGAGGDGFGPFDAASTAGAGPAAALAMDDEDGFAGFGGDGFDDEGGFDDAAGGVAMEDAAPAAAPMPEPQAHRMERRQKPARQAANPAPKVEIDPWAELDPTEPCGQSKHNRPSKRGRPAAKLTHPAAAAALGLSTRNFRVPAAASAVLRRLTRVPQRPGQSGPARPLFRRAATTTKRFAAKGREAAAAKAMDVSVIDRFEEAVADDEAGFAGFGGDGFDDEGGFDDAAAGDAGDMAGSAIGSTVHEAAGGFGGFDEEDEEAAALERRIRELDGAQMDAEKERAYQQLVRRLARAAEEDAAEYVRKTDMSRRMDEWRHRLAGVLEEEEAREAFDMATQAQRVMDGVARIAPPKFRSAEDDPAGDGAVDLDETEVVSFEAAVAASDSRDVCRSFLATLQLANNGNVEIVVDDEAEGVDGDVEDEDDAVTRPGQLCVRLLTRRAAVDLEGYQAPSAALAPAQQEKLAPSSVPASGAPATPPKAKPTRGKRRQKPARTPTQVPANTPLRSPAAKMAGGEGRARQAGRRIAGV